MIVEPKIRGFICTTAHPVGCAARVQQQINYVKQHGPYKSGPKKALIIGSSTGYGLSSRIVCGFGYQAATIGVCFEKAPEGKRTATAGWYNTAAYEEKARAAGLYAKTLNGDAYSREIKRQAIDLIKADLGTIDLLVYSLAAPRRTHPDTGKVSKSVLKPIGHSYSNQSVDVIKRQLEDVTLEEATQEEIDETIAVMGGDDWKMWIDMLQDAGCLSQNFQTVAYSYIGPEITYPVYRHGTIGRAKEDLEATAKDLTKQLRPLGGEAIVSVNKAVVTQSSSAIPVIPLYFAILKKAMIEKGCEEHCIEQMVRMFSTKFLVPEKIVDENGLIRMDDWETRDDVQALVHERWSGLNQDNLAERAAMDEYHKDFLNLFGFDVDGVDYGADIETLVPIPSLINNSPTKA